MWPLQAKCITPLRCSGQPWQAQCSTQVLQLPRPAALAQQLGPTLFLGEQIRANRLAAGSGLAKPGLETREPERRTCSGMVYGK